MTLWLDPVLAKSNSGCYKALVDFIGEFVEFGICTSRGKTAIVYMAPAIKLFLNKSDLM